MSDVPDVPVPAPPDPDAPMPEAHLDVEAERQRLEDLREAIQETEWHAADDLLVGRKGRMFADEGVARQVEAEGDTEHPLADRPNSD